MARKSPATIISRDKVLASNALLKPAVVAKLLGVNPVTLWRMRRRGDFPPGIRLTYGATGRLGWRKADVLAWITSRSLAVTPHDAALPADEVRRVASGE